MTSYFAFAALGGTITAAALALADLYGRAIGRFNLDAQRIRHQENAR